MEFAGSSDLYSKYEKNAALVAAQTPAAYATEEEQ
jgi:hypothetical protein